MRWGRSVRFGLCLAVLAFGGGPALPAQPGGGNRPPLVTIHFGGNQTFLWPGVSVPYQVIVSDPEDGDTLAGSIKGSEVAVAFDYAANAPDTFEPPDIDPSGLAALRAGKRLIARSRCVLCHTMAGERPIPSYATIAEVNEGDDGAADRLAAKIITGGKGVWGDAVMPPHPTLTRDEAGAMARYVLSLATPAGRRDWRPLRGTVAGDPRHATEPYGLRYPGRYLLWAKYIDRGAAGAPRRVGHAVARLRSPVLRVSERDGMKEMRDGRTADGAAIVVPTARRGVLRFDRIDLTDVRRVVFNFAATGSARAAGTVELRQGSVVGRIVARARLDAGGRGSNETRVTADVDPARGSRPLFVVLRPRNRSGSGSIGLRAIEFHR